MHTTETATIAVLDADPDLAGDLAPEVAAAVARTAVAETASLDAGVWSAREEYRGHDSAGHLGLLVLEGLLARVVMIDERRACTELLGPGDVLRPWVEVYASVPSEENWHVMQPSRLAVLDRRFAVAVARWPEVTSAIGDRLVQRARGLAFHLAVCHLKRIDERLLIVLWHFADRWGRVGPDGVVVPIPLTHELLASIVGARRPSVTTALRSLKEEGLADRRPDSSWMLQGEPPANLRLLRERSASVGEAIPSPAEYEGPD